MDWSLALSVKQEQIAAAKLERGWLDVKRRVADLPPRVAVAALAPARKEVPGGAAGGATGPRVRPSASGLLLVAEGLTLMPEGDSPFSLESLIAAELNQKATEKALQAPELKLFPELKRRPLPSTTPQLDKPPVPSPLALFESSLRLRPELVLLWTEPYYFGGRLEDLRLLRGWTDERRDECTPPGWIQGELFLDPYQLYQSRLAGADGVLLSPEGLGRTQLEDLVGVARELDIVPLAYVTGPARIYELERLGVTQLLVGEGRLLDGVARARPGAGPLQGLRKELPGLTLYGIGGVSSLEELDARAYAGADGLFVGRHGLALHQAQDARRQKRG